MGDSPPFPSKGVTDVVGFADHRPVAELVLEDGGRVVKQPRRRMARPLWVRVLGSPDPAAYVLYLHYVHAPQTCNGWSRFSLASNAEARFRRSDVSATLWLVGFEGT
jgi:hypothetical protein